MTIVVTLDLVPSPEPSLTGVRVIVRDTKTCRLHIHRKKKITTSPFLSFRPISFSPLSECVLPPDEDESGWCGIGGNRNRKVANDAP